MYYNSNKSRSNYYNAYKEEMADLEDYNDEFSFQKVMKIGFIILALGLFSMFSIYVAHYFSTDKKMPTITKNTQQSSTLNSLPKEMKIDTPILAKIEKKDKINPKDIALIVEIILAQIDYKKEILLEKQLQEAEKNRVKSKTLKESNHYNKIVVSTSNNETILNKLLTAQKETSSNYVKAIRKELLSRSNEMRIIIVQKGDTLSKIAKRAYGNINAYPKIFMANPEIIKNPNEIFAGQKLRIPA